MYAGKLAVGAIARVKKNNPHGVKEGTLFKVLAHEWFYYHYIVEFLPIESHGSINSEGPYLKDEHIILDNTTLVLYGRKEI